MACVLYSAALAFAGPSGARPYRAGVEMMAKSKSLPFLEAPPQLASQYAGDVGFDPLGFSKSGPQTLTWMREAELKHSRVCMLAVAGWLVVDLGIHFPGAQYEGLRALTAHNAMVESGNMWLLLIAVSILELAGGLALYEQANGSGRAGARVPCQLIGLARAAAPAVPRARGQPPRRSARLSDTPLAAAHAAVPRPAHPARAPLRVRAQRGITSLTRSGMRRTRLRCRSCSSRRSKMAASR